MRISSAFAAVVLILSVFTPSQAEDLSKAKPGEAFDAARFDEMVPLMLSEHKAAGVGIAIIRNGDVIWTGYYGEQGPGAPTNEDTVFNTASVAKTIAAETLIALDDKGLISLDEPIHEYVTHPDLSGDPRYRKLTPRLLMSHRAGLRNWPYEYEDGRAAFINEPGTAFSYSGMGVELAAQYAENKLATDFETLAFDHLLAPLGIDEMSLGRIKPWMGGRLATPMSADGDYTNPGEFSTRLSENSTGAWSAADDLLTTIDAYAELLVAVIDSDWLDKDSVANRTRILTSLEGDAIWNCNPTPGVVCANEYGHGIGWMVYEYDKKTTVNHGGNDAGENALVVYEPETGNGAVILANGGNGIFVTTRILGLIGDYPELAGYYRQLVEKFYNIKLPTTENTDTDR